MGLSFPAWCVGPNACSAVSPGCCCFRQDLQAWMLGPFHVPSCCRDCPWLLDLIHILGVLMASPQRDFPHPAHPHAGLEARRELE